MPTLNQSFPRCQIGKTTNPRHYLTKLIGAVPCHREGANASAAYARNGSARRILTQPYDLLDRREYLLQQKTRVLVGQGVILETTLLTGTYMVVGKMTGVNENPHGNRHLTLGNKVVKNVGNKVLVVASILKYHHTGRMFRRVLGRNIDPPVAHRARKDAAVPLRHLDQLSMGDVRVVVCLRLLCIDL